jgi:hypothetical protein
MPFAVPSMARNRGMGVEMKKDGTIADFTLDDCYLYFYKKAIIRIVY